MKIEAVITWNIIVLLFRIAVSFEVPASRNNKAQDINSPSDSFHRLVSQKTTPVPVRTNVVQENPSLDIGPLIDFTVERGSTARLPCGYKQTDRESSSKLVLWYRNDTTRPFMSYDKRDQIEKKVGWSDPLHQTQRQPDRIFLAKGGMVLVIRQATSKDQAEYRCKVHYRLSPSISHRLKLSIEDVTTHMKLTDVEGHQIGNHVGPLSEGDYLSIFCQADYEKLISLEWMIDGKLVASSWTPTEDGQGSSNLQLTLDRHHAHSVLTCRATVEKQNTTTEAQKSIYDASTAILMYYVPRATLLVDSAGAKLIQTTKERKGGTYQVTEGMTINFICVVKARPPPYNIAWLHNGRIIGSGGRRWTKHNSSLVVSPVTKEDTGLYTCLASNSEGDGQSNAVSLRVSHSPFCVNSVSNKVYVGKNSSASVVCEVEAEPASVNFTWSYESSSGLHRPFGSTPGMQIYTPNSPEGYNQAAIDDRPTPASKIDPTNPKRAILSIPYGSDITEVMCYARNSVGRMRVPCTFTLSFIDPPSPLQGCNVTYIGTTQLKVACVPGYGQSDEKDGTPDLSYVLSPYAKTTSKLEVFVGDSVVANLDNETPVWNVRTLPPDTNITLRVYSVSKHTHSRPVVLHVKTKPLFVPVLQGTADATPSADTHSESPEESELAPHPRQSTQGLNLVTLIGALSAIVGAMIGILALSVILIRRKGRRRESLVQTIRDDQDIAPPVPLDNSEPENIPCSIEIHIETSA